jgi:carboxyl-terminal processing protease
MIQRLFPAQRRLALAALLAVLFAPLSVSAQPTPGKDDALLAQMVCAILQQGHVTRPTIGDTVSKRLFNRFLKDLDPAKVYFLKGDIDEFKKSETELDDMLQEGDVRFAYRVYQRFVERVGQRLKLIDELLAAKQDFSVKEYLDNDFAKVEYATSEEDLRERWRKRIKFDLLLLRQGAKPLSDTEAVKKVHDRYTSFAKRTRQLDNYDLLELFLTGLSASLDPHGAYMSPNTLEDFEISMRLQLEGIGALLREENGATIVAEVVPGGAAAKDGRLKPNDKIIAVAQGDGQFTDIGDMRLREAVKLIRGPKGTRVELKIVPAGKLEPIVYAMDRQRIEMKSQAARYEIVETGEKKGGKALKIGVIDLPSFYGGAGGEDGAVQSASKDVRRILGKLKAEHVDGVILDMRHNPGGLLNEAVALAGLFIDQGPMVQVKDPRAGIRRHDDPEAGVVYDGPLMVLVSRHSASAAEIVAAALQDYGRALVVGDSATHGKGTVQAVVDLGQQLPGQKAKLGALRLTIQQFYRVNGDSTQNKGVVSDIVLPSLSEYLATPEKDLDYALAFDRIRSAPHEEAGMVTRELKTALRARSAERIKASKDFDKLAETIARVKVLRESKKMPLSEQEFKEQVTKEQADQASPDKVDGPDEAIDKEVYKFPRTFYTGEVLKIMEDLIQGKRLLPAQGRLERLDRLQRGPAFAAHLPQLNSTWTWTRSFGDTSRLTVSP